MRTGSRGRAIAGTRESVESARSPLDPFPPPSASHSVTMFRFFPLFLFLATIFDGAALATGAFDALVTDQATASVLLGEDPARAAAVRTPRG